MKNYIDELAEISMEADHVLKLMAAEERSPDLFTGMQVSTEGGFETIKNAGIKLLEILYRLLDRFLLSITSNRNQAENRMVNAKNLIARLEDLPEARNLPLIDIESAPYLTVKGEVPNPSEIIKGLKLMRSVFYTEAIDNTEYSLRMTDKMIPKINTLLNRHSSMSEPDIVRVTQLIAEDVYLLRGKLEKGSHLKNSNLEANTKVSDRLLGNAEVIYNSSPIDPAELRSTSYRLTSLLDDLIESKARLKVDSDNAPATARTVAVKPENQRVMLESSISILELIIEYHVRYYKKINAVRAKMKDYRNRYISLSRDKENDQSKVYLRKLAKLIHALGRWLYSPVVPLLAHCLKVADASIRYCQRSQIAIVNEN